MPRNDFFITIDVLDTIAEEISLSEQPRERRGVTDRAGAISDKKTSAWNLMSEILLPCGMISRNMIQFHLRQRVRSTIKVNERIINLV